MEITHKKFLFIYIIIIQNKHKNIVKIFTSERKILYFSPKYLLNPYKTSKFNKILVRNII